MRKSQLLVTSPILIVVTLILSGCTFQSTVTSDSDKERLATAPPIGSSCSVHFRRSSLGVASANPIPIDSGNHNGADLTVSGEVVKLDAQWLILKTGESTEEWIPLVVILHMTMNSR